MHAQSPNVHGYSRHDITRLAVRAGRWCGRSRLWIHRVETAWSAIGERLCSASEQPTPFDLLQAGKRAIEGEAVAARCGSGYAGVGPDGMPRLEVYWLSVRKPVDAHEELLVERLALRQIWPHLRRYDRDVLIALAEADGHHVMAALQMGVPVRTLHTHLYRARRAFYMHWFATDTPPVPAAPCTPRRSGRIEQARWTEPRP